MSMLHPEHVSRLYYSKCIKDVPLCTLSVGLLYTCVRAGTISSSGMPSEVWLGVATLVISSCETENRQAKKNGCRSILTLQGIPEGCKEELQVYQAIRRSGRREIVLKIITTPTDGRR